MQPASRASIARSCASFSRLLGAAAASVICLVLTFPGLRRGREQGSKR